MPDCIFCKIAKGEVPAQKVYEDDTVAAFLDIHPNNPGHTLVIPKKHSKNLLDIDESDLCAMAKAAHRVARAIQTALEPAGFNIHMNNEGLAGQAVFHSHIHVIPRFMGDGYKNWHGKSYKEGEAEAVAQKIRAAF